MIELNFTGKCKDCECADLKLENISLVSYLGLGVKKQWEVRCIHNDACERMKHKVVEEVSENEPDK